MSGAYAEVIGDPIAQSKSPAIHNHWLQKLGIDADYRAEHVTPDNLAEYIALRRTDSSAMRRANSICAGVRSARGVSCLRDSRVS